MSTPERPEKLPFTFEIIMCLTLNSAAEWAGSMFQVVVTGAAVAVVMAECLLFICLDAQRASRFFISLDAEGRYSLQQVFCALSNCPHPRQPWRRTSGPETAQSK